MSDITTPAVQKTTKPNIEDVFPHYLDGKTLKNALDFIAYLRETKMKPVWTLHNVWKATSKGGVIYYIRLAKSERDSRNRKKSDATDWGKSWVFTPYLHNINKYEELIVNENLQDFVLSGLQYCMPCTGKLCPTEKTVFGKNIKNLCSGDLYYGMALWYTNPNETDIGYLKKLLEFEKQARTKNS